MRVHSARYTQCIHVSSRKLKLPKETHTQKYKQLLPTLFTPYNHTQIYSVTLLKATCSGRLTWIRKARQPQEQRYPFLQVWAVLSCVQTMVYGCKRYGFLTCAYTLMHTIAHRELSGHCKSLHQKVDCGRRKTFAAPGARTSISTGLFSEIWDVISNLGRNIKSET